MLPGLHSRSRIEELGFNIASDRRGNNLMDLIMESVRETACLSADGKRPMSVSVRKHQGSEMASKRLC